MFQIHARERAVGYTVAIDASMMEGRVSRLVSESFLAKPARRTSTVFVVQSRHLHARVHPGVGSNVITLP